MVPIRPISRGHPTTQSTTHPTSTTSPRTSGSPQMSRLQQPRASAGAFRRSGSQQQIVIAQPSPRNSRPKITAVQHGSSYSYGSGPVPTESFDRPRCNHRRSSSQQNAPTGRGSRSSVQYGTSPRASRVSHRSTREKIVIVDEMGKRRESGFH